MQSFKPLRLLFLLLLPAYGFSQTFPVSTIQQTGDKSKRINFVFLGDGYTSAQLSTYITNATSVKNALMAAVPFSTYSAFFNVFAIEVPSAQSGAKHPGTAADESSSGGQPVANPSTYFNSTFDFNSIHRLIYQANVTPITNVLAANVPEYTQGIVLSNSPYYGGAGGTYATSTIHTSAAEIAIHEIGHSFGGLADEYWAGAGYAAEKANMTATSNPATVKWKNWVGINNIGVYAYGGSAPASDWYRPHQSCRMQYLGNAFCSVCVEALISKIHSKVNMIDSYTPLSTAFTIMGTSPRPFTIRKLQTTNNSVSVQWFLNNTPLAVTDSIAIPYTSFVSGTNTVKAVVTDATGLSKSYLPAAGYTRTISWTVEKMAGLLPFEGFTSLGVNKLKWEKDSINQAAVNYILEYSLDGRLYHRLALLPAGQRSFMDKHLHAPQTWYRLHATDADGKVLHSANIQLKNPLTKFNYKVYQDAASHHYRFVYEGDSAAGARGKIVVHNAAGAQILRRDLGRISKSQQYEFDLSGQPAGIYYLSIDIDGMVYTAELLAN